MKKVFSFLFTLLFLGGTFAPLFVIAKIPNDPRVEQWAYKDIGAYRAWDLTTGSSEVIVAVIDNGFDSNHPDLKNNVWKNKDEISGNGKDDDKNGYIDDVWGWNFVPQDLNNNGKYERDEKVGNNDPVPNVKDLTKKDKKLGYFHHGTLVAGLIGAVGNNKKGGAGLNWKIKLMNLKVLENSGVGDYTPLVAAIRYAVDNGAHIINVSAVGNTSKELQATIDYAYEKGVAIIAAAGNNSFSLNANPLYPACGDKGSNVEKVLGVSAIDEQHRLANFSNFGDDCVDITAPGVHIGSSLRYDPTVNLSELYAEGWNGTSFATPIVAGAAALIKSIQPDWQAKEIYEALKTTVHKTPPKNDAEYTSLYGAGLLQVDKAVEYAIAKLPASRVFSEIIVFDLSQGSGTILPENKTQTEFSKSFLRKVDFVAAYQVKNDSQYLAVRTFKDTYQVTLYDQTWKKLSRFTIPQTGDFHFALGNFKQENEPQLVLISQGGDSKILVYSLQGKKLVDQTLSVEGKIQKIALIPRIGSPKQDLGLILEHNHDQIFVVLDQNLTPMGQKISLAQFDSITSISAGDIDGDKKLEYVFGVQVSSTSQVVIAGTEGKIKKQIAVPDSTNTDVSVLVGDFNNDKKEDIAVLHSATPTLSIFDGTGKKLESYPVKVDGTVHKFQLFASFK